MIYLINHKAENEDKELKIKLLEKHSGEISALIVNCFVKNELLKKHKVSYLNKIASLGSDVHKFLKESDPNSKKVSYFYYKLFIYFFVFLDREV